jgi:hypothetical protein
MDSKRTRTEVRGRDWQEVRRIWHALLAGVPANVLKEYVSFLPVVPDLMILIGLVGHGTKRLGMGREWLDYASELKLRGTSPELESLIREWLPKVASFLGKTIEVAWPLPERAIVTLMPPRVKRLWFERIQFYIGQVYVAEPVSRDVTYFTFLGFPGLGPTTLEELTLFQCTTDSKTDFAEHVWDVLTYQGIRLRKFCYDNPFARAPDHIFTRLPAYVTFSNRLQELDITFHARTLHKSAINVEFWKNLGTATLAKLTKLRLDGVPANTLALQTISEHATNLTELSLASIHRPKTNTW